MFYSKKQLHYNRVHQQIFLMHLVGGWHFLCRKENTIRVFARNLLRGTRRRNIFFIFSFWCLTSGLTSNKSTHYLLDNPASSATYCSANPCLLISMVSAKSFATWVLNVVCPHCSFGRLFSCPTSSIWRLYDPLLHYSAISS